MTCCDHGADDGDEPLPPCPYCGAPDAIVHVLTYDAMVDGPGLEESELRCEACG